MVNLHTDVLPNLLPPLSDEERESLTASIVEHGFWPTHPVIHDEDGNVLDGHNRYEVARDLGIDPPTQLLAGLSEWEKVQYAVTSNTSRRQMGAPARRQLLQRLMETHEKVLAAEAKAAQLAGAKQGGEVSKSRLNETKVRDAAAKATAGQFNGPVSAPKPPPAQTKDKLTTYGKMLGVGRATVARDRAYIARIEAIEEAAEEQGNTDVLQAVNAKRPDLDTLEELVGLRAVSATEQALTSEERLQWVTTLAKALDHLQPALNPTETKALLRASDCPASSVFMQIRQIEKAIAEFNQLSRSERR